MPKEVKEIEQDESEKQKLYLNMNLKKIGENLEKMNANFESINKNLSGISWNLKVLNDSKK